VRSLRTGAAARGVTSLDVVLTTEDEPASAPSAEVELTGRDGVKRRVPLTIVGAGHWVSGTFEIGAGQYHLVARFHRKGATVAVPMTIVLT
jgi:hypothetical protein